MNILFYLHTYYFILHIIFYRTRECCVFLNHFPSTRYFEKLVKTHSLYVLRARSPEAAHTTAEDRYFKLDLSAECSF